MLLIASVLLMPVAAFSANSIALDIAIQGIMQARPPMLIEDVVVFSYNPAGGRVRFVGARFSNENYTIVHQYTLNRNGVFVLDYPLPEGLQEIRYRIVVDGLWMSDPTNPVMQTDALGIGFSLFTIDKEPQRSIGNPRIGADGKLTFMFRGPVGGRVSIVGDFNDFDPFLDFLSEVRPGMYQITIRALPGTHFYYFFSEGRRILDQFNPQTGTDPGGNRVSYFFLPS
jgi:hypothetical protein